MQVVVAYGLTEATVNSTFWHAQPGWTGPVPIGVPDPNTRAYVLDGALRPVAVGVAGELYVGGRGLARGYLRRPGLSVGALRRRPVRPGPAARMYRTGDRARWRADGALDFLGRDDGQVKIRGHPHRARRDRGRAACATPPSAQAAVIAREDQPGTQAARRLRGRRGREPSRPTPPQLRAHLARELPEHMVPAVVIVLDGPLPLTPNGKLDRRRPARAGLHRADRGRRAAHARPSARSPPCSRRRWDCRGSASTTTSSASAATASSRSGWSAARGRPASWCARATCSSSARSPGWPRSRSRTPRPRPAPRATDPATGSAASRRRRSCTGCASSAARSAASHQSLRAAGPGGLDRERLERVVQALLDRHDLLRARLRRDDGWALEVPRAGHRAGRRRRRPWPARRRGASARRDRRRRPPPPRARLDPDAGRMVQVVWLDAGRRGPAACSCSSTTRSSTASRCGSSWADLARRVGGGRGGRGAAARSRRHLVSPLVAAARAGGRRRAPAPRELDLWNTVAAHGRIRCSAPARWTRRATSSATSQTLTVDAARRADRDAADAPCRRSTARPSTTCC